MESNKKSWELNIFGEIHIQGSIKPDDLCFNECMKNFGVEMRSTTVSGGPRRLRKYIGGEKKVGLYIIQMKICGVYYRSVTSLISYTFQFTTWENISKGTMCCL